jgi:hypothetical protein
MVQIRIVDVTFDVSMTQNKGELAILKNLDKIEKTRSVADEIVKFDPLNVARIALEVTCRP